MPDVKRLISEVAAERHPRGACRSAVCPGDDQQNRVGGSYPAVTGPDSGTNLRIRCLLPKSGKARGQRACANGEGVGGTDAAGVAERHSPRRPKGLRICAPGERSAPPPHVDSLVRCRIGGRSPAVRRRLLAWHLSALAGLAGVRTQGLKKSRSLGYSFAELLVPRGKAVLRNDNRCLRASALPLMVERHTQHNEDFMDATESIRRGRMTTNEILTVAE